MGTKRERLEALIKESFGNGDNLEVVSNNVLKTYDVMTKECVGFDKLNLESQYSIVTWSVVITMNTANHALKKASFFRNHEEPSEEIKAYSLMYTGGAKL